MSTAGPDRIAYLDHAATTPMRDEAVEAMLPFLTERFANPSGSHTLARDARRAIDEARESIAESLGCAPGEVVFTGSGTEADNLAVAGRHEAVPGRVVCSAIEHHAVLHSVEHLGGTTVPVDARGIVDLDALRDAVDDSTTLVSVMLVNNEVGTVQPLEAVIDVVRATAPRAAVHTDAVQAFAWVDVAALARDADLVAISGHKFGGPKGVGALVVRGSTSIAPQVRGGGQEHDLRSGTHNVAGIVALAAAARAAVDERKSLVDRVTPLRDRLADGLLDAVPGTIETGVSGGDRSHKIPGNVHVCFDAIEAEALLFLLERAGVMASAASSCASGAEQPSHVLAAMGVPRDLAKGSLRLSLGRSSLAGDVDQVLAALPPAVERLRTHDRR